MTRRGRVSLATAAERGSSGVGSDGEWVAGILKEAIRRGDLQPGTPLVQRDLATALGVSRIPVRDALQTLLSEGLVTAAGRRLVVTELTAHEVDELYSLRLLIEPDLAPWIISNSTNSAKRLLRTLVERMDAERAENDQVGWSRTNFAFHDALYASAQRPMFARIAHQLLTLVESYSRMATMYLGGWDLSQQEHHVMVDAIDRSDAAALREALEIHLRRAQSDLVEYMVSRAAQPTPADGDEGGVAAVVRHFADAYRLSESGRTSSTAGGEGTQR